ncbi:anthranilate synthase component 1 [Catenovulum sp. SM1970]|uniref:anthranilate synthase component 1 n=1 Tax=Marinifaba aquimaris TaxID=2741323 RepID=UPI001573E64B|nr:anthranilate synthase component 1 [Marinifaba aquimaris]NTS76127.1 anthranilate synthase component 1 [Marinifaba aquimaris]
MRQNMLINTTELTVPYINEPLAVFEALADDHHNTLLLESAEIDSKDNLKSLMLIDASLRLECRGQAVAIVSFNKSGQAVLNYLKHQLANYISQQTQDTVEFIFERPAKGLSEDERLKADNPFVVLREIDELGKAKGQHHFATFLGGVLGYDLIGVVEQLPDVPNGQNDCPDYMFYLAETLLVSDHQNQTAELIHNSFSETESDYSATHADQKLAQIADKINQPFANHNTKVQPNLAQTDIQTDKDDAEFKQDVLDLKHHIQIGNIFQVVPSRTFSLPCQNPIAAYRELKKQNPSPYMFFIKDHDFQLFGASPESAVKYTDSNNEIEVYPIAGTRRRGFNTDGSINLDLDSRIEQELRSDTKELSEHMMLVDLARNDIARVAKAGTRYVSDLQKVDRYSFVMHLVSRVKGELREDLDALHAYQACLNMGTLVGAPKVKAAQLIRQTEKKGRGSYGGAVGYLAANGDMDTCIVIRSAFVKNDVAHVQAGAGVVYDSDPQSEADETRAKAQAVLNAIIASQQVDDALLNEFRSQEQA